MITTKRIYEPAAKRDGVRILVDRLWPRGVSKEDAVVDIWAKELAPSSELRQWFGHDPERWEAFKEQYHEELTEVLPLARRFITYLENDHGTVTLLFAAKDEEHSHAVALEAFLLK